MNITFKSHVAAFIFTIFGASFALSNSGAAAENTQCQPGDHKSCQYEGGGCIPQTYACNDPLLVCYCYCPNGTLDEGTDCGSDLAGVVTSLETKNKQ